VLLDLRLPDRAVMAIIKHFRDSSRPVPPVIVLSAKRVAAVEEAALMIRAADVVHKPFDMGTLLGSIAAVLAQSAPPSPSAVSNET
jgi:DNA-binding response OmpR family regulator